MKWGWQRLGISAWTFWIASYFCLFPWFWFEVHSHASTDILNPLVQPSPLFSVTPPDFSAAAHLTAGTCAQAKTKAKSNTILSSLFEDMFRPRSGSKTFGSLASFACPLIKVCPQIASGTSQGIAATMGMAGAQYSCAQLADRTQYQKILEQITAGLRLIEAEACTLKCQTAQLADLEVETTCAQGELLAIQNQIGNLGKSFNENIQALNTLNTNVTKKLADAETQKQDVENRLNGSSGNVGLVKMVDTIQNDVNTKGQAIQEIQSTQNSVQLDNSLLNIQTQQKLMSLTMKCLFNDTQSNLRCYKNGPPVTAEEYEVCSLQRSQQVVGTNGRVVQGGITSAQIEANVNALKNTLSTMKDNAPPPDFAVPTSSGGGDGGSSYAVQSPADAMTYINQLQEPYKTFTLDMMTFCQNRYQAMVNADPNINVRKNNLTTETQGVQQSVGSLSAEMLQNYSQATASLSGRAQNLDLSACQNASIQTQIGCLSQARGAEQALLQGTAPNSKVSLKLKSSTGEGLGIQCSGMLACMQTLSSTGNSLDTAITGMKTFQETLGTNAMQAAQKTVTDIATRLQPQASSLRARSQDILNRLTKLGPDFTGSASITGVQGEALKNENGLPGLPDNLVNLIGGNPALGQPLITPESLNGILDAVKTAQQTLLEKTQAAQRARSILDEKIQSLDALALTCQEGEGLQKSAETMARMRIFDCQSHPVCTPDQSANQQNLRQIGSVVENLKSRLKVITPGPMAKYEDIRAITRGLEDMCRYKGTGVTSGTVTHQARPQISQQNPNLAAQQLLQQQLLSGSGQQAGFNPLMMGLLNNNQPQAQQPQPAPVGQKEDANCLSVVDVAEKVEREIDRQAYSKHGSRIAR